MKFRIVTLITLLSVAATARIIAPFPGWNRLKAMSSDIIVVRAGKLTPPEPHVFYVNGPRSDFQVEIISVLKGTNCPATARLWTDHALYQGEDYLVFGYFNNQTCVAYEQYKVLPVGSDFSTNWIAGKSLDEQIEKLFAHARFIIDREIKQDQEVKAQLETGIAKP